MREVRGDWSAVVLLLYLYKRGRRERGKVGRHSSSGLVVDDVLCYLILTEKNRRKCGVVAAPVSCDVISSAEAAVWRQYVDIFTVLIFSFLICCFVHC